MQSGWFYFCGANAAAAAMVPWKKSENPTGGFAADEKAPDGTNHLFVVASGRLNFVLLRKVAMSECKTAQLEMRKSLCCTTDSLIFC